MKEENTNYTYQPKEDKFAFRSQFVTVPSDTAYVLKLFQQDAEFKFSRARQLAQNRIGFAYEGTPDSLGIKILSEVPDDFSYRYHSGIGKRHLELLDATKTRNRLFAF